MAVPLTPEQVREHPEFPFVTWDLPPTKKGKVPVAKGRGGPINISYEVHGHGPIRLVWIMGLGSYKTAWQRQTKYFGHDREAEFSSLIFDNRGMAESDKPLCRYSTSEMARDVIELVDHLGWTEERQLHIVGISMGGMIAQELALLIPNRVSSLSLISTAARIVNTIPYLENLRNRINLLLPTPLPTQIANAKRNLFSLAWLSAPDELAKEHCLSGTPFPTNGDRFAAQELLKRSDTEGFTKKGFMLQLVAAGWHHKTAEQLKELGDKVGRERIMVVHGEEDRMITAEHGKVLARELGEVRTEFRKGQGHVIPVEERWEFHRWVGEMVEKGEKLRVG